MKKPLPNLPTGRYSTLRGRYAAAGLGPRAVCIANVQSTSGVVTPTEDLALDSLKCRYERLGRHQGLRRSVPVLASQLLSSRRVEDEPCREVRSIEIERKSTKLEEGYQPEVSDGQK